MWFINRQYCENRSESDMPDGSNITGLSEVYR